MFSLAVKLAAVLLFGDIQADRLSERERAIWMHYRHAVVTLYQGDRATGVAALIDDSGYFVTHNMSVTGTTVDGKSLDGKQIPFNVVSRDSATQLVLLKTSKWVPGTAKPFRMPTEAEEEGGSLIAVLPTGPIRAAYVSKNRLGVLNPSRRLVPLTEIRFEASPQAVGGALIFCENGELIGTLNATLERPDMFGGNSNQSQQGGPNQGGIQFGQGIIQVNPPPSILLNQGPAEMTVAYTVGAQVIQHTLEGFLSPDHEAAYASLGVFCTDAIGGGALIQKVTPGSPAYKSKLQPGDVIANIQFNEITDQVAFARVMLQQSVGKKITLVIKRGHSTLYVDIIPAKAAN